MKNKLKAIARKTSFLAGAVIVGIVIGISLQFALAAWSEPPAGTTPPDGNVGAPINTSNFGQSKSGNLMLNQNGTYANGLLVPNGNVGIGTMTPAHKLHVINSANSIGAGVFYDSSASAGYGVIARSDNGTPLLVQGADGASLVTFQAGGNVGIGTTNPGTKLVIAENSTSNNWLSMTNTGGTIYLGPLSSTGNGITGGLNYAGTLTTSGATALQLGTNSAAQVTILNGGNVGIGTVSPGYKMDVAGDVNITGSYRVNGIPITSGGIYRTAPSSAATSCSTKCGGRDKCILGEPIGNFSAPPYCDWANGDYVTTCVCIR